MTDIQHEKFMSLMGEVEGLEEQLAAQQKSGASAEAIAALQDQLADARHRLQQISDGCGTGRNPGV
jgi:ribosome-interacting GTPase 1